MPKAIVRYKTVRALRNVTAAHPYAKYIDYGMRAYNTGRAFAPYAKTAIKYFNSRKRKKVQNFKKRARVRRSLGRPVGFSTAKRNDEQTGSTLTMLTKTLYSKGLIAINKDSSADDAINSRMRDIVNMRGVKICFWVRSLDITDRKPLFFNWAIIVPKQQDTVAPTNDSVGDSEFFRGNGADRAQDFSTLLTFLDLKCLPINTDRYMVLRHRRLNIASATSSGDPVNNQNGEQFIEHYIPIKRQLIFDGAIGTLQPKKQMYMVWWCSNSTNSALVNGGEYRWRIVRYFKEPKT